ncbi:MAG: hypothetical protein KH828_02235 [Clostridiales bacterium]|nr:hypothetical protein [Clostridiales bacterium]
MAKFCTKCGKRLEEGEICTCEQAQTTQQGASQGQSYENQNYQQGQPYGNQNYQQGQPYGDQNYQQGQPYGNQNYQQGQPYGNQNYQQGQPYENQNYQQGQPYGNQNYQQGQPYGNPYNQQGMTKEAEWFNQKKDALVAGTKNMFGEILPILKAPVSRVRQIAESNSPAVGIEFIVTKGVICLLLLLIIILRLKGMMGMAAEYVKIPYFKLIFFTLVMSVGADFLQALLLKAFTALFNGNTNFNAMLSVVGARTLYDSLMILVTGILVLIYPTLGLGFFGFASLILPYIEFGGYQAAVQCDENKKPYAFFVVKVCMTIILTILTVTMMGGIITSLAGGMSSLF